MEQLTQKVLAALSAAGISALERFPAGVMPRLQKPLAAVEVQSLQTFPSGLGDYLGLTELEDGATAECYGRKVSVTLLVRLYAAEAAALRDAAQKASAVLEQGVDGVRAEEMHLDETRFDAVCDCYVRDLHLRLETYFAPLHQEAEHLFTDFKLEGEFR